jgi:hypothetical protein
MMRIKNWKHASRAEEIVGGIVVDRFIEVYDSCKSADAKHPADVAREAERV